MISFSSKSIAFVFCMVANTKIKCEYYVDSTLAIQSIMLLIYFTESCIRDEAWCMKTRYFDPARFFTSILMGYGTQ